MSAVAAADVPHGNPDTFGGLVRAGETPEQALRRLEKTKGYSKSIGTDEGQRLLAAATSQVAAEPNGGVKPRRPRIVEAPGVTRVIAAAAPRVGMTLERVELVPIASIDVGPNVRVNVAELDELASSIQEHGVLQPIKVRPAGDRFTIVWGQRRFLAAQQVGMTGIPALIDVDDKAGSALAIEQLVENLHRADLPPLDRARAMRAVVDAGMSQADLAKELGLAPSTISNDLGLLEVAAPVAELIAAGALTPSHVKPLKGLAPSTQVELAKRAVDQRTTSHGMEDLVRRHKESEEWRKKQEARERQEAEAARAHLEAQIANLGKKKVPLDADIRIVGYGQPQVKAVVADLIRKAGYTNVTSIDGRGLVSRSQALGCDCSVWKVEVDYGRVSIVPGCLNAEHAQAKTAAADAKRRASYATATDVQAHLAKTAGDLAVASPLGQHRIQLSPLAGRMALWHALGYRAADWSEKRGGKRGNPWVVIAALDEEQLAAELGEAIAEAFRDNYGYHVDWAGLARELGLVVDLPPTNAAAAATS